jgi:protein tyrosine/serine phosphatase
MRALLVASLIGVIVGGPIAYHYGQKKHFRNFRIVEPGILYRSGKLTQAGLDTVIRQHGIRTVVNFRAVDLGSRLAAQPQIASNGNGDQPDPEEEAFCRDRGIRYERIVYRKWHALDGNAIPADQSVAEFRKLMDERKAIGPILIHCLAGKHRTGSFAAIYRMEYQGWPNADALREMQEIGYDDLDREEDVRSYLDSFRPRK